jgi:hypothetical protein
MQTLAAPKWVGAETRLRAAVDCVCCSTERENVFILGVTTSDTKVNSLTCTRTIDISTLNTLKDNAVCNFKGILSKELRYKVRSA